MTGSTKDLTRMENIKINNDISVERYNYGATKVALLHKYTFDFFFGEEKNIMPVAKNAMIDMHLFDIRQQWFLRRDAPFRDYEKYTVQQDVQAVYEKIYDYIKLNKIRIVIVLWTGPLWNEKFISRLREIAYVACYFGDDPDEGSEVTSKYYVKFYDYAFCGGVYFDAHKTIAQQFLDWGAKKSKFIPLGSRPTSHLGKKPGFENGRDIDVVYIGTNKFKKFFFIARVKRHFGDRMQIFGKGWNGSDSLLRTIALKILKLWYGIGDVKPLSPKDALEIYSRAKIGLNMHQSYGPSNVRSYELPLNGVMQITDNEKGYKGMFTEGKDIIFYKNQNHKEAIKKIEHYLTHDAERIEIAKNAFKQGQKFKLENTFKSMIDEIRKEKKFRKLIQG